MVIDNERKKSRMTCQRLKIIEYLRKVKKHPTAEMVYKEVLKELPTITLATVYRNLNLLAEKGEITRFKVNEVYRFDGETCEHQHAICKGCGNIIDINDMEITEFAMNKIRSSEFKADCVNIIYRGYCKECKRVANIGCKKKSGKKKK